MICTRCNLRTVSIKCINCLNHEYQCSQCSDYIHNSISSFKNHVYESYIDNEYNYKYTDISSEIHKETQSKHELKMEVQSQTNTNTNTYRNEYSFNNQLIDERQDIYYTENDLIIIENELKSIINEKEKKIIQLNYIIEENMIENNMLNKEISYLNQTIHDIQSRFTMELHEREVKIEILNEKISRLNEIIVLNDRKFHQENIKLCHYNEETTNK